MNLPQGIEALPNDQWVIANDTHFAVWSRAHGNIITDPHLMKFLRPYLENVEVVWDVGACIGDHTRQYLDWGKKVVAIEPNPLVFECLQHNCPEAVCLNFAASDHEGVLRFSVLENVGASRVTNNGELEVPCHRLDSFGLEQPGFVKIDTEGCELFVLQGMAKIFDAEEKPIVFCEINLGALEANGTTPDDIFKFFSDRSYRYTEVYPRCAQRTDPQYDVLFLP